MVRAVLLTALLLSGCYSTHTGAQWPGWSIKAGTSASATYASEKAFGSPWLGAVAVCGLIVGYEYEDTRGGTRFQSGKLDSAMDVASGCVPGLTLSLFLR